MTSSKLASITSNLVGIAVGVAVGDVVGLIDGQIVGDVDGWIVGYPVVGIAVGITVGVAVGKVVGISDGATVGISVVTVIIFLMRLPPTSAIYKLPTASIASPEGFKKLAATPEPSAYAAVPLPAQVETLPDGEIFRMRLLNVVQ